VSQIKLVQLRSAVADSPIEKADYYYRRPWGCYPNYGYQPYYRPYGWYRPYGYYGSWYCGPYCWRY
jgi:hypothetical protein